jgi:hypothetical protein
MNVKPIAARRPRPTHAEAPMPMHPDYPIAQSFRSDDPAAQQQLMQQASHPVVEPEQALLVTDYNGLRVLGRSEQALDRVAGTLRRRLGAALVAGPREVRYGNGDPVLEPHMVVLVHGPASCLARVREDLLARGGRIARVVDRSMFVLEGEAPLARLLGYRERMREMLAESWSQSHVATWLSRYVPVEDDGPEAA